MASVDGHIASRLATSTHITINMLDVRESRKKIIYCIIPFWSDSRTSYTGSTPMMMMLVRMVTTDMFENVPLYQ